MSEFQTKSHIDIDYECGIKDGMDEYEILAEILKASKQVLLFPKWNTLSEDVNSKTIDHDVAFIGYDPNKNSFAIIGRKTRIVRIVTFEDIQNADIKGTIVTGGVKYSLIDGAGNRCDYEDMCGDNGNIMSQPRKFIRCLDKGLSWK